MNTWDVVLCTICAFVLLLILVIFYKLVLSVKLFGKSLSGLNILVTGAGSGIGRELCLALAKEGSNIICVDVNTEANDKTKEDVAKINNTIKVDAFTCDVSKYSNVQELAKIVYEKFEHVDILINNAGVGMAGKIVEFSENDIKKTIDVNLMSLFWMVKAFLPDMINRNKGHIVVTASALGKFGGAGATSYSSSKFAITGFMESLYYELQFYYPKSNIKLSTAYPFSVETGLINSEAFDTWWMRGLKCLTSAKDAASDYIDGIKLEMDTFSVPRWKWHQILILGNPFFRRIPWPKFLIKKIIKSAKVQIHPC